MIGNQLLRAEVFQELDIANSLKSVIKKQTLERIQTLERVQRRSTKFILSLPFQTDISYPKRLAKLNILPITYWHEYLDLVYLFKCIYENSDKNVKLNSPNRVTRRSTSSTSGLLLQITKSKTVTFQNSFYIRACKTLYQYL